jgi:hypothetical protein
MPGKKGSGLRSSEKELPERRSGAFRHKNTPAYYHIDLTFLLKRF